MSTMLSIIESTISNRNKKLNILTFPTHERYQSNLARTGHNFFLWQGDNIKEWNSTFAPLPQNHVLLRKPSNPSMLAGHTINLVLSQNKFGQFPVAQSLANLFHVPLISIEHTLPVPNWPPHYLPQMKQMSGDLNLFISEYSRNKWGWTDEEATVVHHGIDEAKFIPNNSIPKKHHILSVCNDWINRDLFCGFKIWQEATQGLPVKPVGDTPGLSKAANNIDELIEEYQTAKVFINTSTISPIPTSLLEAMSCGCAVVSLNNCMIPEIIEHNKNGLLANNAKELRECCVTLLRDNDLCRRLGAEARKTIENRFSLAKFVDKWNSLFYYATRQVYIGA